jgi:hypothetical protein
MVFTPSKHVVDRVILTFEPKPIVFLDVSLDASHCRLTSVIDQSGISRLERANIWLKLPGEERVPRDITTVDSTLIGTHIGFIEFSTAKVLETLQSELPKPPV